MPALLDTDPDQVWVLDPLTDALPNDEGWRRGWEVTTWSYVATFAVERFAEEFQETLARAQGAMGSAPNGWPEYVIEAAKTAVSGDYTGFHRTNMSCGIGAVLGHYQSEEILSGA